MISFVGPLQCWWVLQNVGGSLGILVGPYIIEKVNIFNIIGDRSLRVDGKLTFNGAEAFCDRQLVMC